MNRYDEAAFGIEEELVGVPVGAALVGADAGGEQEPPVEQEHLFLPVDAEVLHRPVVLEHAEAGRLVGILLPREQRAAE